MASIFSNGSGLAPVIARDLGYTGEMPATVQEALSVPGISRGIALYTTVIAGFPFAAEQDGAPATVPAWLNHTDDAITPGQRIAALMLELIFHRDAVLWVQREQGTITGALLLPRDMWQLDSFGRITFAGQDVSDQSQFVYFQSLMPMGLLTAAGDTIRHYMDLRNTIRSRSRNPIPLIELKVTEEFEGTNAELVQARDDWSAARRSEDGAVAFTPKGVNLITHTGSGNDSELMIQARNAVRIDAANFLNINAAMLDGNNGTSDTYSNTLQNANEFLTLSLRQWMLPIEQRLSQDDVTPPGMSIRFDTSGFDAFTQTDASGNTGTATPTQTPIESEPTNVES